MIKILIPARSAKEVLTTTLNPKNVKKLKIYLKTSLVLRKSQFGMDKSVLLASCHFIMIKLIENVEVVLKMNSMILFKKLVFTVQEIIHILMASLVDLVLKLLISMKMLKIV